MASWAIVLIMRCVHKSNQKFPLILHGENLWSRDVWERLAISHQDVRIKRCAIPSTRVYTFQNYTKLLTLIRWYLGFFCIYWFQEQKLQSGSKFFYYRHVWWLTINILYISLKNPPFAVWPLLWLQNLLRSFLRVSFEDGFLFFLFFLQTNFFSANRQLIIFWFTRPFNLIFVDEKRFIYVYLFQKGKPLPTHDDEFSVIGYSVKTLLCWAMRLFNKLLI